MNEATQAFLIEECLNQNNIPVIARVFYKRTAMYVFDSEETKIPQLKKIQEIMDNKYEFVINPSCCILIVHHTSATSDEVN